MVQNDFLRPHSEMTLNCFLLRGWAKYAVMREGYILSLKIFLLQTLEKIMQKLIFTLVKFFVENIFVANFRENNVKINLCLFLCLLICDVCK